LIESLAPINRAEFIFHPFPIAHRSISRLRL
jgi:hypothetical protein